jgi:tripartite-type tricarboxylate transporter receptor subunit TctC
MPSAWRSSADPIFRCPSSACRARRAMLAAAVVAGVGLLAQGPALAQAAYPAKPVRLVVSYAAGNVTDLLARIVADKLSHEWGQPVTVDNRPGEGGSLGAQLVAKAPADGYTLLFSAMAALAINPHVYSHVGYQALKDFSPVVSIAYPDLAIVVDPSLNITSFKELVAYSKAHPKALNYGTAGNGTVPHLNMEALKLRTGLVAQHVPYKSAAAVTSDVIGGRLQIQQDALSVVLPQVKAGRLTAIAAGATKRVLPDVPSVSEAIPGFIPVVPWLGILAPAGTPAPIVAKIYQDVHAVLMQPEVQNKLLANGLTVSDEAPEAFTRTLAADYDRLGKLVKQLGIKVD